MHNQSLGRALLVVFFFTAGFEWENLLLRCFLHSHGQLGSSSAKDGAGLAQCAEHPFRQAELCPRSRSLHPCRVLMAQVLYCRLPGSFSDTAGPACPRLHRTMSSLSVGLGFPPEGKFPQLPRSAPVPALHTSSRHGRWFCLLRLGAWVLVTLLDEEGLLCFSKVSHSPDTVLWELLNPPSLLSEEAMAMINRVYMVIIINS